MSDERTMEAIETELAAVAAEPLTNDSCYHALQLIELWLARGNARSLIEQYAASENPAITRALSFLLARAASSRQLGPIGAVVLRAVELLRVEDETTRINFLTALQLSSMYDDLVGPDEVFPSSVVTFLIDCTEGSDAVLSTLAAAVAGLYGRGLLRTARPEQLNQLRSRLRALKPEPGSLLEDEIGDLGPFLAEAP